MSASKKCLIPKLSEDLAEEVGIHIGDGSMWFKKHDWGTEYRYSVHGDKREKEYLVEHVSNIIKKLYGLDPIYKENKNDNSFGVFYNNKNLVLYKFNLGLPNGKKENIVIPKNIYNSKFVLDCIRGIFDTDGCLQFQNRNKFAKPYPRIDIASKSEPLIKQIATILDSLNISYSIYNSEIPHYKTKTICKTSRIFIFGSKNLDKWIKNIGFSNPKNIKKYENWKLEAGIEPASSTLPR